MATQQQPVKEKCGTCYGYGMWGLGLSAPMGSMDARDGLSTIPCPECGKSANPIKKDESYTEVELSNN